jgi:hypothetical protein
MTQKRDYLLKGIAPADSPRRCQARSNTTREQCKKWALKGKRMCKTHRARERKGEGSPTQEWSECRSDENQVMGVIYRKHMSKVLQERLDEFLEQPQEEQLALYEELSIMRVMAVDAIKLYDGAVQTNKAELVMCAAETLKEALTSVGDMVKACADIEAKATDKVSTRQLNLFIMQICRAVRRIVGEENIELAQKIIDEINESVHFNVEGMGTTLTPDQQAHSMDETIPLC